MENKVFVLQKFTKIKKKKTIWELAWLTITGQTSWTLVINMHHSPYTFSFEFKFASIFVSQNLLLKIRNICDSDLVWIPLFHYILTADKWLYGKFQKQTNLIQIILHAFFVLDLSVYSLQTFFIYKIIFNLQKIHTIRFTVGSNSQFIPVTNSTSSFWGS